MVKHLSFSSWEEWQFIHRNFVNFWDAIVLGSNDITTVDIEKVRAALLIVKTWKWRGTKIPSAVEISAQIVTLFLQICLGPAKEKIDQDEDVLRLALSTIIIRGVNSTCDELQEGAYAQSIASLAVKAGLPRWLVDVRHEATHTVLPSLDSLLIAAKELFQFYRRKYWNVQAKALLDSHISRESCASVLEKCKNSMGKGRSIEDLDELVDKLAHDLSSKSFPHLLIPELLRAFERDPASERQHDKWERILAGFNDTWSSFDSSLLDALCNGVLMQDDGLDAYLFWIKYLISRRWHSLSEPNIAQINPNRNLLDVGSATWSVEETRYMEAPAPSNKQKNYRLDFWFRKALLTPHQAAQKLLGDLIPAIYEVKDAEVIFQRVTQAISLYYGRHNTATSTNDGIELSLDELEEKIYPKTQAEGRGKKDEEERVRIPKCELCNASNCNHWHLVSNFENCPVGSFPKTESGPFIGILESYSVKYMMDDNCNENNDRNPGAEVVDSIGNKRPHRDSNSQSPGVATKVQAQPFKVRLLI